MPEQILNYDPAEAVACDEAADVYLADAFETGNAQYIAAALEVIARARGTASKRSGPEQEKPA